MKTIKLILVIALLTVVFLIKAQKNYKYDNDILSVNGTPLFKVEKVKNNLHPGIKDIWIKNMEGKKLIFIQFNEYDIPGKTLSNGQEDREMYYEITFLGSGNKAEVRNYAKTSKLVSLIAEAELVKENEIDAAKEKEFVMVNGTKFSQQRDLLYKANNSTIIINNPAPQKAGVNISISR